MCKIESKLKTFRFFFFQKNTTSRKKKCFLRKSSVEKTDELNKFQPALFLYCAIGKIVVWKKKNKNVELMIFLPHRKNERILWIN